MTIQGRSTPAEDRPGLDSDADLGIRSDDAKQESFFTVSGSSPPRGRGLAALATAWRAKAEWLRALEAQGQAAGLEHAARELENTIKARADETLTIPEAAAESGYSEEHLRRLVRQGDLPAERNGGRGSRIHIRRADLPIKRRKDGRETPGGVGYDPEEDARGIAKLMEAKR